jgi:hypothetical protein
MNRSLTRGKINDYLRQYPDAPNREVAVLFRVTPQTVGKIKKEREAQQHERDRRMDKVLNNTDLDKGGVKYDQGKLPYHLLPPDAVEEVLKVLDYGAKKYRERNWEAGMKWSRCFSALMRHMWAYWKGEDLDKETGISHLAHAGCCILFLLSYHLRKVGEDDRPKGVEVRP